MLSWLQHRLTGLPLVPTELCFAVKKKGGIKKKDRTAFDADDSRVSASTPLHRPACTDPNRDATGPDVARLTPQITFPLHLWKMPCFTQDSLQAASSSQEGSFR